MSMTTTIVFASPGAQAEYYSLGLGRVVDALGRVLRARVAQLRSRRSPATHESVSIVREAERMLDSLRARAERTRVLSGRPVF